MSQGRMGEGEVRTVGHLCAWRGRVVQRGGQITQDIVDHGKEFESY